MKKYIILLAVIFISIITKAQNAKFYILNVAAVSTNNEAELKSKELIRKGYSAGFLWIPDYASLSGAKLYSVYIGPFATQYECEVATDKYKKLFPGSYGLLVSQDNKRVQINGVGKVAVTEKQITPNKVVVKIFFKDLDMSGYEGNKATKPAIAERDEFRKKNKYTFCYDSEEFNSLQISGTGEKLTLKIMEGDNVIFSKTEFDLKDKIRFTSKDFNFEMGSNYTITINQNGKNLFIGVIDSQGCM
jgi:translation initiation factor IF-1